MHAIFWSRCLDTESCVIPAVVNRHQILNSFIYEGLMVSECSPACECVDWSGAEGFLWQCFFFVESLFQRNQCDYKFWLSEGTLLRSGVMISDFFSVFITLFIILFLTHHCCYSPNLLSTTWFYVQDLRYDNFYQHTKIQVSTLSHL